MRIFRIRLLKATPRSGKAVPLDDSWLGERVRVQDTLEPLPAQGSAIPAPTEPLEPQIERPRVEQAERTVVGGPAVVAGV